MFVTVMTQTYHWSLFCASSHPYNLLFLSFTLT